MRNRCLHVRMAESADRQPSSTAPERRDQNDRRKRPDRCASEFRAQMGSVRAGVPEAAGEFCNCVRTSSLLSPRTPNAPLRTRHEAGSVYQSKTSSAVAGSRSCRLGGSPLTADQILDVVVLGVDVAATKLIGKQPSRTETSADSTAIRPSRIARFAPGPIFRSRLGLVRS